DLEHTVTLADRIGDPVLQCRARYELVWARYQQCDVAAANAIVAEVEKLVERVGLPAEQWRLVQLHTGQLLLAGRAEEAEVANERALEIGSAVGLPDALGAFGGMLYNIRLHQGRIDEIVDFFLDVVRDNPSIAALRAGVAMMLADLGRLDEARERLATEAASGFEFPNDATWLNGMNNLLEAAATSADVASARALVDR